jgi:branched-chain amino acid aminotransferase
MGYKIKVNLTQNSRLASLDFNKIPFGQTFSDHMFIAQYYDGKWQDCEIKPFGNIPLHPANVAIHYGQSIFEGMKASKMQDGTPALFRIEKHVERINASARRLCMPEIPGELFTQAIETLVDIDRDWIPPAEGSTLYIRPFMFACDESLGVRPSSNYTFMVIVGPVGPYYAKPVTLWAEEKYIRAAQGGMGEAKAAGNYGGSLMATKIANENGYDQIIWLDANKHKYLQEVGTMNLMLVIDGIAITPPTDGTILKGITRDSIITILRDKGITVEERPISILEVTKAYKAGTLQEVFGCGTAAVVSHVSEITYRKTKMILPPVEDRKIGNMVKMIIDKMRTGEIADKYGWVQPIKVAEMV